ncbi:putative reverse transcriptase domain-containing protein [Tanacetum coccineum]|uniref:Reverse transcriptase domain-containing protein n=1 Tax=Tanacetum coccineum TaxID=301880 RepID=A0ABQ5ABL8_9ASTR
MTAFETRVRQDTDEVYTRLDDEQSQRQLLAGRLNMLFRDRRAHAYTRHQMETEARLSREAWRRSMDASDLARGEVMSLRTTVLGQMLIFRELHAADRRRQAVISEMLKADQRRSAEMRELRTTDHTRQQQLIQTLTVMQSLQGQVTTLQGQVTHIRDSELDLCLLLIEGTAGTRWRSCTARAARGGWYCMFFVSEDMAPKTNHKVTHQSHKPKPQQPSPPHGHYAQLQAMVDQGVITALATHVMQIGMAMTATLRERVAEGLNALMETIFRISNCPVENQVKFSTCTLLAGALTWWNSHVMTVSHDAAYAMTWADLRKKMTDKYCPRNEMKKLEAELWNLKVKGTDVIGRECPKLKNNKNHGNQVGNDRAPAKVYVVGHAGTNPDSNIVTGTFLLNNRYASILFDTGADRSFVSTAFSSQMDITPSTLDHYYDVELADGRIIGNRGHEARLHIISYSKTQEYMLKGCPVFLAHVTTNEVEDKSEKKRLEDVPIVRDFPEVFLVGLAGSPPTRQWNFKSI